VDRLSGIVLYQPGDGNSKENRAMLKRIAASMRLATDFGRMGAMPQKAPKPLDYASPDALPVAGRSFWLGIVSLGLSICAVGIFFVGRAAVDYRWIPPYAFDDVVIAIQIVCLLSFGLGVGGCFQRRFQRCAACGLGLAVFVALFSPAFQYA
jgi:hypothetical protein